MASNTEKIRKQDQDPGRTGADTTSPDQDAGRGLGRQGAGTAGHNWTESQDVAKKGRYADENKVQGEHDRCVDTDVSEAV